jgi:hypothetical protein
VNYRLVLLAVSALGVACGYVGDAGREWMTIHGFVAGLWFSTWARAKTTTTSNCGAATMMTPEKMTEVAEDSLRGRGYAVFDDHGIDVRTVAPTERGAMVNWLVASCGIMISQWTSDALISGNFEAEAEKRRARVAAVRIELEPAH